MEPIINVDETPGKVVGRRRGAKDGFESGMRLQEAAGTFGRACDRLPLPKGVFRFQTHEEADQWMLKMLARHRKN